MQELENEMMEAIQRHKSHMVIIERLVEIKSMILSNLGNMVNGSDSKSVLFDMSFCDVGVPRLSITIKHFNNKGDEYPFLSVYHDKLIAGMNVAGSEKYKYNPVTADDYLNIICEYTIVELKAHDIRDYLEIFSANTNNKRGF